MTTFLLDVPGDAVLAAAVRASIQFERVMEAKEICADSSAQGEG
jgi:hypothetical protein